MTANDSSEHLWNNNARESLVGDQDWDRSDCRHDELVSPSQVNHIVDKAEKDHQANT